MPRQHQHGKHETRDRRGAHQGRDQRTEKASQADDRVIVIGSETRNFLEATLVLLTTLKSGTVRAVTNNPVIADVEVPIQA